LILRGHKQHCIGSALGVNLAATHVVLKGKRHGAIRTPDLKETDKDKRMKNYGEDGTGVHVQGGEVRKARKEDENRADKFTRKAPRPI